MKQIFLFLFFSALLSEIFSQCLITGADLSYVNTIEQKGGIYKDETGGVVDPFEYFALQGAEMIRLRLWHTPENKIDFCGDPITSSNLTDVLTAAGRIKSAGMNLNLSIHYGDYFNDPGNQMMPEAWLGLTHSVLLDSIYQYTYRVIEDLYLQNTIPDIVSIGNETTWGFIDETVSTDGFSWPDDAEKFNAGLNAIDDFNLAFSQDIKKALHFTESTAEWLVDLFQNNGIQNYDIIGISFYPFFSPNSTLEDIGQIISNISNSFDKELMIFETGFIWTNGNADAYGNFVGNNGNVLNYPLTAEGQKEFLTDFAEEVYTSGGTGLFYWEPAWISSDMCDLWGQGSSYENASFFDFNNDNRALQAFDFFEYCNTSILQNDAGTIELFPNPVIENKIIVNSETNLKSWELFNSAGQFIERGDINKPGIIKISFKNNIKGVYFLVLTSHEGEAVIKKMVF